MLGVEERFWSPPKEEWLTMDNAALTEVHV